MELQNLRNAFSKKVDDPQIEFFYTTLGVSLIIGLVAILLAFGVWNDGNKIVFITPLKIEYEDSGELSPCLATHIAEAETANPTVIPADILLERCYKIESVLPGDYNSISLVQLAGVLLLIVAFFTLLILYGRESKYKSIRNLYGRSIYSVVQKILVALAFTLFLFVVFSAFEKMGGLIAIDDTPMEVLKFIAVLTIGAFMAVATFLLINWVIHWDFVDISVLAIVILIVSYTLSILVTTHNWSQAYSRLGNTNHASVILSGFNNSRDMVSGFHGSRGLFLFTMMSLALIIWAFSLDIFVLLKGLFEKNSQIVKLRSLSGFAVSAFIAGLGAMIMGLVPSNESDFHNVGTVASLAFSLLMIILLGILYPKASADSKFKSRQTHIRIITGLIGTGLAFIFIYEILSKLAGALGVELAYFIMFLLYIQIYAKNLAEYIDEVEAKESQTN